LASQVDKILGPGNQYVTAAKMLLQNSEAMISMDMPAGPSEVRSQLHTSCTAFLPLFSSRAPASASAVLPDLAKGRARPPALSAFLNPRQTLQRCTHLNPCFNSSVCNTCMADGRGPAGITGVHRRGPAVAHWHVNQRDDCCP